VLCADAHELSFNLKRPAGSLPAA